MMRTCSVTAALWFVLAGVGTAGPPQGEPGQAPAALTGLEKKLARGIVEKALTTRGLINPRERAFLLGAVDVGAKPADRVYYTEYELLPADKDRADRLALLTVYRYREDTTIFATVDLNTEKPVKVETVAHRATRLAEEEAAAAKKLALADPQVKKALAPVGGKAEIGTLHPYVPASDTDPGRGRRLVRLSFRVGDDYLAAPRVTVDLTARTVTVEQVKP